MKKIIIAAWLVCISIMFSTANVFADCQPLAGTSGDDVINCIGNDTNGINVGIGDDLVTIMSGRTYRVVSEGGILTVYVLPGAFLGSYATHSSGIIMNGYGDIFSEGSIAGRIVLNGNGSITHIGDINTFSSAVEVNGTADVVFVGDITSPAGTGIVILFSAGHSTIYHIGDIKTGSTGLAIYGSGTIVNRGDIAVTQSDGAGIRLTEGVVIQEGDISGVFGIGMGNGDVFYTGNIKASLIGIFASVARVFVTGSITITSDNGVAIVGNDNTFGLRNNVQQIRIDGTIDAPTAMSLQYGNDIVEITGQSVIRGDILLGPGDDVIVILPGAEIVDTIYGGEGREVAGDTLYLDSDLVCREDDDPRIGEINAAISDADPNSGTLTYQGQTYTFAEFERLASGIGIQTCFPWMQDGRINSFDHGAPVALYCTVGGGVSVWDIDENGSGTFSFALTAAQISEALTLASSSGAHQQFGSDAQGNSLYALSDGISLQFMGPEILETWKTYQFNFDYGICQQD